MGKSLVIVESKAKAETINKYLGRGYTVKASMGHVRDLPKKDLAIDVDHDFEPTYVTIRGKGKVLKELRAAAKTADTIYLASDLDREGEAIAWHVAELLKVGPDKTKRVVFNEITKNAILEAMEHPREIDIRKVNAQQARRILDRLVGYEVSPILWKTIYYGLSAGRVQSVALRLICEREDEIDAFDPIEFWTIDAIFETDKGDTVEARLDRIDGKKVEMGISESDAADAVIRALEGASFRVSNLTKKEKRLQPNPPFITSTLQREASNRLRFSSKKTMVLAQQLYEGLPIEGENVGLITYMRTDSTRMSDEAVASSRSYIFEHFGEEYLEPSERRFKTKKGAQDAHEAIRPTAIERTPESMKDQLSADQFRLYQLIWRRFVATQMQRALYENTAVVISTGPYDFRASGSVVRFAGWTAVYPHVRKDVKELPALEVDDPMKAVSVTPNQRFTKPPPRYSEATLIKELEAQGIGRPSTYAAIVDTLKRRRYVLFEKRVFTPTELGRTVWSLLAQAFPHIFEVQFTADMESELDRIESGDDEWVDVVGDFYRPFKERLDEVEGQVKELKQSLIKETEERCEKCGSMMVEKWGRNGRFLACSTYPKCKATRPVEGEELPEFDITCEKCGGKMKVKHGRFGEFLGCSNYPECKHTMALPTGVNCPEEKCSGYLVKRRTKKGRTFYGCSAYPECGFAIWDKPVPKACPSCEASFMVEKKPKGGDKELVCLDCGERVTPETETSADEPQ